MAREIGAHRRLGLHVIAAWLAISAGCASGRHRDAEIAPALITQSPLTASAPSGRVVDAPENLVNFAPADVSVTVDAATVNLRQVFEDLGPEATLWYQHVQTLANPFFEGRAPDTDGADTAADYIEFWFEHYGLEPAFGEAGYRQPFTYTQRSRFPEVTVDHGTLHVNGEPLKEGRDFVVLGNSGSADVGGGVSFVGYGIESGPGEYTSFEHNTDLAGRIALLLRYAPMDDAGESLWDEQPTRWLASVSRKMNAVAGRGAAAILLVNPPGSPGDGAGLESLRRSRRFGAGLDIPALQITPEVAGRLLHDGDPEGRGLGALRRLADTGRITSFDLSDTVQVGVDVEVSRRRDQQELHGQNLGAILRGRGGLEDEYVVIGAHWDHVGVGATGGVMPGNRGLLHPGADDNASGTAGVLVLAGKLRDHYESAPDDARLRSVLLLTFDGEEMGLKGSSYFADHSPIDPSKMSIQLNMDMIGRLRSNNLSVLGVATGEDLSRILRPHFEESGLTVAVNPGGSGRSDDANFHRMGVPALHFFTGMHKEYTSPADQAYTVNPAGAEKIVELLYSIVLDVAARPHLLVYTEAPTTGPGQDRGYGRVRLGIRPGMGEELASGVLVDAVSDGTSAAEAGMQSGDVIIAWNGKKIDGLAELFEKLQVHDPGDVVVITVLRDGEQIDLDVTLKGSGGDG